MEGLLVGTRYIPHYKSDPWVNRWRWDCTDSPGWSVSIINGDGANAGKDSFEVAILFNGQLSEPVGWVDRNMIPTIIQLVEGMRSLQSRV